ncbi:Formin-like protein [Psidium guajava]|nr:Formin-like protein [Psidium guajava]
MKPRCPKRHVATCFRSSSRIKSQAKRALNRQMVFSYALMSLICLWVSDSHLIKKWAFWMLRISMIASSSSSSGEQGHSLAFPPFFSQ